MAMMAIFQWRMIVFFYSPSTSSYSEIGWADSTWALTVHERGDDQSLFLFLAISIIKLTKLLWDNQSTTADLMTS